MALTVPSGHDLRDRYANLVLEKLRYTLVTKDHLIFNNRYEGDPKAGNVKVPVRDTEVAVRTYNRDEGIQVAGSATSYMDLPINVDIAVNEIIDGFDAAAVPDGIVAERLDSAGYAIALELDDQGLGLLVDGGTQATDKSASTKANIMSQIVAVRTALGAAKVPVDGRYLIVSPKIMGLLLLSEEFIKAGDLSQELVAQGVVGRIAGFNVFESNNIPNTSTGNLEVEFIAGHPNWSHRVYEWKVTPYVQSLDGDANYIGASAIKGRLVYGQKLSRATTVMVKVKDPAYTPPVDRSYVVSVDGVDGSSSSSLLTITFAEDVASPDLKMTDIKIIGKGENDDVANIGAAATLTKSSAKVYTIALTPAVKSTEIYVDLIDNLNYNFVPHTREVKVIYKA